MKWTTEEATFSHLSQIEPVSRLGSYSDKSYTLLQTSARRRLLIQHRIDEFYPDPSPISSCIKHIRILFPHRIIWKARLVQRLTCIIKHLKKFCVVFSDIYQPELLFLYFSQQE